MSLLSSFNPSEGPRVNRPGYTVKFQVEDIDLSTRVENVYIINSINSVYPVYIININADSKEITKNKFYGQKKGLLGVKSTTPDNQGKEDYNIDLMILSVNAILGLKKNDRNPDVHAANGLKFICLAVSAFKNISKAVDKLVTYQDKKTPLEVVKDIINKFAPGVSTDISEDNKNTDIIFQCKIPQDISLKKSIDYIDKEYGLYKGTTFFYCSMEDSGDAKIKLWELNKKMSGEKAYKVNFKALANDEGNNDTQTSGSSGSTKEFVSQDEPKTIFKGTASMLVNTSTITVSRKPVKGKLTDEKEYKVTDILKNNGIVDGNSKELQYFKDVADERKTFLSKSIVGTDDNKTDSYITKSIADLISKCNQIEFKIDRGVVIGTLSKIGEPIELSFELEEYNKFNGKYMCNSSVINVYRAKSGNYNAMATIKCYRGNTEI